MSKRLSLIAAALSAMSTACPAAPAPTLCERLGEWLRRADAIDKGPEQPIYDASVAFISTALYETREGYGTDDFDRDRRACMPALAPDIMARMDRATAPRALRAWYMFVHALADSNVDPDMVMQLLEPPRDGLALERDLDFELEHLRWGEPVPSRLELRAKLVGDFLVERADPDGSVLRAWQRRLASPTPATRLAAVEATRAFVRSDARRHTVDTALELLRDDPDPDVRVAVRWELWLHDFGK